MGATEPAFLGMMAHRSRLLRATPRARRVSKAPGSKSGMKTAAGCTARRVVETRPLAEMVRNVWGGSDFGPGSAVTLTAEQLRMALNCTWRRLLAAERQIGRAS